MVRACAGTKSAPQDLKECRALTRLFEGTPGPACFASGPFSLGSQRKRKSPWDFGRRSRLTFGAVPIARAPTSRHQRHPREIKGLDLSQPSSQKLVVASASGSDGFQPKSGTRLNVCALGDRRGSGGEDVPSSRSLRREDLGSRGNSVRAVAGDLIGVSGAAPYSKEGCPHVPVSNSRPDRLLDPSVYPRNRSPLVYTPCHSPIEGKWCSSKQVDSRSR
jgi:hypothetical protein